MNQTSESVKSQLWKKAELFKTDCSISGSSNTSSSMRKGGVTNSTSFGGEVDAEGSDGVLSWVSVQLGHKQVVVLHPQRKLLHI